MSNAVWQNGTPPGGVRAFFSSRLLLLVLALTLAPVFAATPGAPGAAKGQPRLASLQLEVWPEYDRPAALVIIRGELAKDVELPAVISLRIAAASGGPTAVAYSTTAGGNLLNLQYDKADAGNFITLKFTAPERFFHVEFYDPLKTSAANRSYTYVWPGDLAAERVNLIVQEPAAASNISVQPALNTSAAGQDGLNYRSADIGPNPAGKRLEVKVQYSKSDTRTSAEIVKPAAPAAMQPINPPAAVSNAARPPYKVELALWLLGIVSALGLCIWAALTWWYGRETPPAAAQSAAGFCKKCGAPSVPGARFCSRCGAAQT